MRKIASPLALTLVAVLFLSCDRPENQQPRAVQGSGVENPDDQVDQDGNRKFGSIDISDERYLRDVKDLIAGNPNQLSVAITNRKSLKSITSKAWARSEQHAVQGIMTSDSNARKLPELVRCHFVDLRADFGKKMSAFEYSLVDVEVIRGPSQNYILHLESPLDKKSKFISCLVPAGQGLTAFDVQKTFGNDLGLAIYLK